MFIRDLMKSVNQINISFLFFNFGLGPDWTEGGGEAKVVGRIFLFIIIFISKLCSDLELGRV